MRNRPLNGTGGLIEDQINNIQLIGYTTAISWAGNRTAYLAGLLRSGRLGEYAGHARAFAKKGKFGAGIFD